MTDVFEALTSRRHYREPLPVEEAFEMLDRNIGTSFDRDCVEALVRHYHGGRNGNSIGHA